jgi:valyl-tRNA synthetase
MGDPDVMDTWATSSLTPQIAARWEDDRDLFERVFPMDLRPQGGEIIRTWLFSTLLRSHYEHGTLPWSDTAINGWVLDPDRKKMSKSKGNVVTPVEYFDRFGSDAVRYWAMNGRPGVDTAFDEGQIKVGRRLAIKLLNATKFALGVVKEPGRADVTEPVDRAMLGCLRETIAAATDEFENYDYAGALERTERFFWHFCDNYLELVKGRSYGGAAADASASAQEAIALGLSALQRLLAPHLPFVTEEVWSWWQDGSIHTSAWPTTDEIAAWSEDGLGYLAAADVLGAVRKAKSDEKRSLKTPARRVVVRDTPVRLAALKPIESDLREAGAIDDLEFVEADDFAVEVDLAEPGAEGGG